MTSASEPPIDWLCDILSRHDPLGAWPPTAGSVHDYQPAARLAVQGLQRTMGLGHGWTIVADALDRLHPGFYRALKEGDNELTRRLGLVAREIWDRHVRINGLVPRREERPATEVAITFTQPPVADLVADEQVLTAWLRRIEDRMSAEGHAQDRSLSAARSAIRDVLPALADAYAGATDEQRTRVRLAFSRFRRVLYELWTFVALRCLALRTHGRIGDLRQGLLAESILDLGVDWRDELLTLQDMRKAAETAGLPFADLVREAANISSPRGAEFLLGVIRAG